jgi:hypothetical protein
LPANWQPTHQRQRNSPQTILHLNILQLLHKFTLEVWGEIGDAFHGLVLLVVGVWRVKVRGADVEAIKIAIYSCLFYWVYEKIVWNAVHLSTKREALEVPHSPSSMLRVVVP